MSLLFGVGHRSLQDHFCWISFSKLTGRLSTERVRIWQALVSESLRDSSIRWFYHTVLWEEELRPQVTVRC